LTTDSIKRPFNNDDDGGDDDDDDDDDDNNNNNNNKMFPISIPPFSHKI